MTKMTSKYQRRTPEQQIQDLESEIERVRQRAELRKAKADPVTADALKVTRALNKAADRATDPSYKAALTQARGALEAYLESKGVRSLKAQQGRTQRSSAKA